MKRTREARNNRTWYTVVGVYVENWQKFCDHVRAIDAREAEEKIRNDSRLDDDLVIVGVFEGRQNAVDESEIAQVQFPHLNSSIALRMLQDTLSHNGT